VRLEELGSAMVLQRQCESWNESCGGAAWCWCCLLQQGQEMHKGICRVVKEWR
jgi:hypothetical protein